MSRFGRRVASMSLRQRLTLLTVGAFTVGLLVLGFIVPRLVRPFLMTRLDTDLQRTENAAIRQLGLNGNNPFPGRGSSASDAYYEFRDENGMLKLTAQSDAAEKDVPKLPTTLKIPYDAPITVDSLGGGKHWRVVAFQVTRIGSEVPLPGFVVTAIPTTTVDDTVSEVVRAVTFAAIAILVALACMTYLLVGIGLRPLRKMQKSAAGISSAGDLDQRVEQPSEKTELGQLGATLNGMLGRLEASFDEQQESQARLRRFVSDASHELRTPLTSIRGYAELHRRGYKDPVQVDRSMDRIEQESSRMSRLVEDLLALARADEKRSVQQLPVRLDEVVRGLVEDLRVVHPDRRITVDAAECTVLGDRALLTQSVVNVLANAGIHTPAGTPIDVVLRPFGTSAVLTIADHGTGIAPDDAAHVFDRFYRSDVSRNRESGGSGLGLSITASIIEAHGGAISTSPTAGGGATFTITLPMVVDAGTAVLAPPPPPPVAPDSSAGERLTSPLADTVLP